MAILLLQGCDWYRSLKLMDKKQESEWMEAQKIGISGDLIAAAERHLEFLAAVDRRRFLYDGPLLERAIYRYTLTFFWEFVA